MNFPALILFSAIVCNANLNSTNLRVGVRISRDKSDEIVKDQIENVIEK